VCVSIAAAAVLTGGPVRHAAAAVLVVGDSLAVGTESALRAALPSEAIDTDARNGRFSSEAARIVAERLRPDHATVVFDLGTNDGPRGVAGTARSLAAVRDLVGGSCLVVATLNHPNVGGTSIDGQNEMIERFVATTPNTTLVDWHAAASAPGALRSDGVHATTAGYAWRGALFADAIEGCARGGPARQRPRGPGASTTSRPADARSSRRRTPPPLEARVARTIADATLALSSLAATEHAADLLRGAGSALFAVLTPRGPEPVLGAAD